MPKVVVMGAAKSGKTALCERLTLDQFSDNYIPTVGSNFHQKTFASVDSGQYDFEFWDLHSNKKLLKTFLTDVDIVLCVFSTADKHSFTYLKENILADIELNPFYTLNKPSYLLIGTNTDKPSDVDQNEIMALSSQQHMPYFAVSSSSTNGIESLWLCLKERVAEMFKRRTFHRSSLNPQDLLTNQTKIERRQALASKECGMLWDVNKTELQNIRLILDDYARGNNGWNLWFTGHVNRHHTWRVAQIVDFIDQNRFSHIKEIIEALDAIPHVHNQGSLSLRISFIKAKFGVEEPPIIEEASNSERWCCGLF